MTTFDFSPLYRTSVGFDRLASLMSSATRQDQGTSYPPYNILITSEDHYRITMAVAGFGKDDLEITSEESTLTIAFWFTSLVGLGSAPFAATSWTPIEATHWPWLLLLGVTGTLGQLCLVGRQDHGRGDHGAGQRPPAGLVDTGNTPLRDLQSGYFLHHCCPLRPILSSTVSAAR